MPSGKARLYIALYVRGGQVRMPGHEDKYHWALLVGAKNEKDNLVGTKYHAKNAPGLPSWMFEEREVTMTPTNMILVRILIGKVSDPTGLAEKLRSVPVVNGNPDWNCVTWIQNALAAIAQARVMGTSILDWPTVSVAAMRYCQEKTDAGRFNGEGNFDTSRVPTLDLLQGKEIVS